MSLLIKYLSRIFSCAFLLLLHLKADAQEPGMWHITDDDGLPSRTVYHTVQDHKGYIWMGTEKGICRFDGQKFKVYKSEEFNDNEILKVEIDPLGRVWFRNLSGQLFYIDNEIIHNAQHLFSQKLSNVSDFIIDDHTIWIIFQNGTKQTNKYHLTRLSFDKKGVFSPLYIYDHTFSAFHGFRKSEHSIYIFPRDSKNDYKLIHLDKELNTFNVKNNLLAKDGVGLLSYYVIKEQLYLLFSKNQEFFITKLVGDKTEKFLDFKKKVIINNLQILDEQFWILTSEGLIVQSILSDQLKESPSLLANKSTNHLMVDHEGNKWISTTGNGIYIITAPQTQVIQTNNFNLPNNEIYSLEYDHLTRRMLLGHSKGQVSIINDEFKNQIIASNPSGRIVDILVDQSGDYWCVNEAELIVFNPDLTVKKRFWPGVKTLLQTKNEDIWMGAYKDVSRMPQEKIDFIHLENKNQFLERILFNRTYTIYQDYADDIWIGTVNGLHIYRDTVQPFLENEKQIAYNVSSITQSMDSIIWVATRGDGLIGIKDNKVIERIKAENGLASNTIKKIFTTPHQIWVATDNGVTKIDLKSKRTEWINTADGLPSNEVNDIEIVGNQVWVATSKGLAIFSVTAKHKNKIPPPIYISNIKLEEKNTIVQDSFLLSYDQNNIQIDMIGLGYKGKGDISYQYKLFGLENNWVHTSSQFARYPNLPPGEYYFEVFAVNEDQVKSNEPASVYFSIRPP